MPQALRTLGRRMRQTFGISAPRMAVRTHLSWRWRLREDEGRYRGSGPHSSR